MGILMRSLAALGMTKSYSRLMLNDCDPDLRDAGGSGVPGVVDAEGLRKTLRTRNWELGTGRLVHIARNWGRELVSGDR
jgi:hypothetical protein